MKAARAQATSIFIVCETLWLLAVGTKLSAAEFSSTNPPVTFHYVQADEFGYVPYAGTTFLVTNHSDAEITVDVMAVETKSGTNWRSASRPSSPITSLQFCPAGASPAATSPFLRAHHAGFVTIAFQGAAVAGYGVNHLPGEPQGFWRLRLNVQQQLTGLADVSARTKMIPQTLGGASPRVAGLPRNPYSQQYTFFGKPISIVSPEILGWYSTLPPLRRLTNSLFARDRLP